MAVDDLPALVLVPVDLGGIPARELLLHAVGGLAETQKVERQYCDVAMMQPTGASVADYIASRANVVQRADCRELMALFKKVTRHSPRMWGPSIVGYGEGPLAGFAIRGRELVVYLTADSKEQRSLLSKLGKHKMGKVCLYFKQLADLDRSALEQLVVGSVAQVRRRHIAAPSTRKPHSRNGRST